MSCRPCSMNEQRLVEADLRRDEVGPLGVQALERLLEGRQPEEPVVLVLALELDQVDRALVALHQLGVGLEVGAAGAVPALVGALVDVAVVVDALHHPLDHLVVLGVGGADEEVVGHAERGGQLLEAHVVAVAQLARRDALALGHLRDRLAVLVGAGEEEDLLPALAHVAGENVGRDRRVRVPQMGLRVHVVDRRRDVVRHAPKTLRAAASCVTAWGPAAAPAPPRPPGPRQASAQPRSKPPPLGLAGAAEPPRAAGRGDPARRRLGAAARAARWSPPGDR